MLKDAVEFFGDNDSEALGPLVGSMPLTPSRKSESSFRLQKTNSVIPPFPESIDRN
jgi:hypothetical protein